MKPIILYLLFALVLLCNTQETKVYMVISSHLDAGWLSTFDQYYTGEKTPEHENVKAIYNDLIPKLEENSNWTYAFSEVGFFARWWQDQSNSMKERVKTLFKNKQLEFVNGGWVSHDEATPTYEDMLENLAQGSVWLKNNLEIEVDIGWQLDSFGTGSTHASLLAQAGYRILFFSRINYIEREIRRANQELEFIWKPPNPHNSTLLTHIFGSEYGVVRYFYRTNPVSVGDVFNGSNLKQGDLETMANFLNSESKVFRSPNLLFNLVGDFYNPVQGYSGMQNMVDYFNNKKDIGFSIEFSSLTNFTDSLYRDLEFDTLPNKTDDFFPYVSSLYQPWTGYFASKPSFKALVRGTSHYLNAMRSLFMRMTFTIKRRSSDDDDLWAALTKLGQVLSILQHHDSITGTMKEFVRYDYEDMVKNAMQDVETQMQTYFTRFLSVEYNTTNKRQNNSQINNLKSDTVANYFFWDNDVAQLILDPIFWGGNKLKKNQIVQDNNIPLSFLEDDSDPIYIFAFNPGMVNETVVSLTIPKRENYNLKIEDTTGKQFSPDIFCLNIPHDTCYIRWMDQFSRLQTKIYRIIQDLNIKLSPIVGNELNFPLLSSSPTLNQTEEIHITESISLSLLSDYQTLLLTKCNSGDYKGSSAGCNTDYIQLRYMYYDSYNPPNNSGAYLFRPGTNGNKTLILNINGARLYQGESLTILEFYNNKVTSQLLFRISDVSHSTGFEVITLVDGSIAEFIGIEIVLSLKYLNMTENTLSDEPNPFYVDTNGYYFATRIYGAKNDNTINGTQSVNVPRNFYPMTTMMFVNDTRKRMTIITDRAQGVTYNPSREVEIMIHRITKFDDNLGVLELLDEKYPGTNVQLNITTRHFVLLTDSLDTSKQASIKSREYEQPIQLWNVFDVPDGLFNSTDAAAQQSTLKDDFDISKKSDSPQDIDSNFIKLSTLDSVDESLLIRFHNTHDSETQQLIFCGDNSTVGSDFLKMLGSPTYLVGIKSVTAQHLTNHKTIANISCEIPIQLLPQELRTFQITFVVNSLELEEDSTLIYWILGLILLTMIAIGLYFYRRANIRKKLGKEGKLLHEPQGTKNVNVSGESENWLSDKIEENSSL